MMINSFAIKKNICVLFLSLSFINAPSYAGHQKEEDLKDEVAFMLSQAVADLEPSFSSFDSEEEEFIWIDKHKNKIATYFEDEEDVKSFLKTVHYEATRAGLDPSLILGLIQVESNFNKYAISSVEARGYMQIMPFWTKAIGNKEHNLFYLRTNLRYGTTILRHYLELENGNLFMALGRYNGSRGQSKYPNAVLNAQKRFLN